MEATEKNGIALAVERAPVTRTRKASTPKGALATLFAAFRRAGIAEPSNEDAAAILERCETLRNVAQHASERAAVYVSRNGETVLPDRNSAEAVVATLKLGFAAMRDGKSAKALKIVAQPNPKGGSPLYQVRIELPMQRDTVSVLAAQAEAAGGVSF